jgi:hypothetical protein
MGMYGKRHACIGRFEALAPHCPEPRCPLNQRDQSNCHNRFSEEKQNASHTCARIRISHI